MSDAPKSIHSSTLTIMGVELIVHNLDNGERVIEADGVEKLLEMMALGNRLQDHEAMQLARIIKP